MSLLGGRSAGVPALGSALGLLLCLGVVQAEEGTARLELKKLETEANFSFTGGGGLYREVYPQSFFAVVSEDRLNTDFVRLVKRQPKYNAQRPMRGVVKLGGQEYVVAVDSKEPAPKDDNKKDPSEKQDDQVVQALDRLYFDFNHNGDLSDDKPVDALTSSAFGSNRYALFPRVDVKLQVEGKSIDYAFSLRVYSYASGRRRYASASLTAAAYREGELVLEGKRHKVALIDYNSNGRFDDQIQVNDQVVSSNGAISPIHGDVLVVDPDRASEEWSGYDLVGSPNRHHVSKLARIDGRFYHLSVSPAGDEICLRPVSPPLGRISTSQNAFAALLLGPDGVLQVRADKDHPAEIPAGEWKLLACQITAGPQGAKPTGQPVKPPETKTLFGAIVDALFGSKPAEEADSLLASVVEAVATADCKAVAVKKGEATALAFGPPYRPVVKVQYVNRQDRFARLELVLVGGGGEVCTNLRVGGRRPSDPAFTIRDAKGKVIVQDTFKYG